MKIIRTIKEAREWVKNKKALDKSIGLIPTMGALHAGHLSLIQSAGEIADTIVVSIFVNPTQFNNEKDFESYPVSLENDLRQVEGYCDMVFCPDVKEMYSGESYLNFDFGEITKSMEGKFRPGHFSGVALIVSKLFNILTPDYAWFGKKDYQQLTVIKVLNRELGFGIDIIGVDTVREKDGLALSSRNRRLNKTQRKIAPIFHNSLKKAEDLLSKSIPIDEIKNKISEDFSAQEGTRLEYLEFVDSGELKPISSVVGYREVAICIAGYIGDVRLIDNTLLTLT